MKSWHEPFTRQLDARNQGGWRWWLFTFCLRLHASPMRHAAQLGHPCAFDSRI